MMRTCHKRVDVDLTPAPVADVDLTPAPVQHTSTTDNPYTPAVPVQHTPAVPVLHTPAVTVQHTPTFKLEQKVTTIEGTASATRQYVGVIAEIDLDSECYIVLCQGVRGYRNGYHMTVPFTDAKIRINQPVHTTKRKRRPKNMFY